MTEIILVDFENFEGTRLYDDDITVSLSKIRTADNGDIFYSVTRLVPYDSQWSDESYFTTYQEALNQFNYYVEDEKSNL